MKKKVFLALVMAAVMTAAPSGMALNVWAAVEQNDTSKAYDAMIEKEASRDELDLIVKQKTLQDDENNTDQPAESRVQVSGLTKENALKYSITTNVQGDASEVASTVISSYSDGVQTVNALGTSLKNDMTEKEARQVLNSYVYLYLESKYLTSLSSSKGDNNTTVYQFETDGDTAKDYVVEKLGYETVNDTTISLNSMKGTITVDSEGNVLERKVTTSYSISLNAGEVHNYTVEYDAVYVNGADSSKGVKTNSAAKISSSNSTKNGITECSSIVYATSNANVRAAASTNAEVIGGVDAGDELQMTGKTSDNWIRINFDGNVGFVYGDYISEQKPSSKKSTGKVNEASGQVTTGVETNFRTQPSSDSDIIEVIPAGTVLEQLGVTDTGWIQVSYHGNTGFIAEGCTGWTSHEKDPEAATYSLEGIVSDVQMNTLGVNGLGGSGYYNFNINNASIDAGSDGIQPGVYVEVEYQISGGTYYAISVDAKGMYRDGMDGEVDGEMDGEVDGDDGSDTDQDSSDEDFTVLNGCIIALDYPDVTVAAEDGNEYSANLKGIGVSGYLEEGQYVQIYLKDGDVYRIY